MIKTALQKVRLFNVTCATYGCTVSVKGYLMIAIVNEIFSNVANVSYYCELNSCHSRIKQLVSDWKLSHSTEISLTEDTSKSLSEKYNPLEQSVSELSAKIDNLPTKNSDLQMEIDSASKSFTTNTQLIASSSVSISTTLTILDELADRDRRSRNLILYNLDE